MTKDNKRIVRRFLKKLWNEKDKYVIDELIADYYVDHTPPPNAADIALANIAILGPETFKQIFSNIRDEFFDIHVSIKDQIAEGDKVVTHMVWECSIKSKDAPLTASQVITAMGIGIDRIEGGKIVENWNTLDVLYKLINAMGLNDPFLDPDTPAPPVSCSKGCAPGYFCNRFNLCQRVGS